MVRIVRNSPKLRWRVELDWWQQPFSAQPSDGPRLFRG